MKVNIQTILDKILNHSFIRKIQVQLRRVVLPGFDSVPLFDVLIFFFKRLLKGELSRRAASLSYNFFMALFPLVLFLFTIIAFLPIEEFIPTTYEIIQNFVPKQSFHFVKETIDGILQKNGTLLSVSILFTFYFATRGTTALINELNVACKDEDTRRFLKKKLVSLFMLFMLVILFLTTLAVNIGVTQIISYFASHGLVKIGWHFVIIRIIKWLLIVVLVFVCISVIYYFAPVKKREFHFFSAGSSLATVLIVLSSAGFNFYISNFSRYNAVYGSIGTLIILLLWIQLISMILLIGFELNVSIRNARKKKVI